MAITVAAQDGMQQQIAESREQRIHTDEHLNRFAQEYTAVVTALREYTEHSADQVAVLRGHLPSTETSFAWPVWHDPFGKSQPASVERTERMLKTEEDRHQASKPLLEALQRLHADSSVEDLTKSVDELAKLEPGLPREVSERVRHLRGLAQSAVQQTSVLAIRAQTRTGWVLWVSLVGICCAGVIWPLSYLSAYDGTHRSLMLGSFGVFLLALLAYMLFQLITLMCLARVGPLLGKSG
jgi:hypothetical protein